MRWIAGWLSGLLLLSCGGDERAPQRRDVHVYAATSLREAVEELVAGCERERPDLNVVPNFGASDVLVRQVLAARSADLFLSADTLQMDTLAQAGQVVREAPRPWLSNQLVVVVPLASELTELAGAAELASRIPGSISIGNPESVPAGRYARGWLEAAGVWADVAGRIAPGADARTTLAAVESGACAAGVVYSTDAATSERVRVVHRVPEGVGPRVEYALGLLRGPADAEDASAVFERFQSGSARDVLAAHGFLPGRR